MKSANNNRYLLLIACTLSTCSYTKVEEPSGAHYEAYTAGVAPEVRSWFKHQNEQFAKGLKKEAELDASDRLDVIRKKLLSALGPLPSLSLSFDFSEPEELIQPVASAAMAGMIQAEEDMRTLEEKINDEAFDAGDEEQDEQKASLPNYAYLGEFLKPWEYVKGDKNIDIQFENAELINLIRYFEKQYELTFILDDIIKPPEPGARQVTGVKFSFKTEQPLNKKQAWNIFVKFLDMAGLMIIPGPEERVYLITNNARNSTFSTSKDPLPTFIGIDYSLLPTSDIKIRYVYFIQNTTANVIKTVADNLKSTIAAPPILIEDLNALILTDRASNVRSILAILKELDKPVLPETLTIIKLQQADASKVKALYDSLVKEETSLLARLSPGGKKQTSISYFTENVRMIADQRTNSLILLGPVSNVEKIALFIRKEIDKQIDLPYSPLHVYPLKYIDAEATAQIVTELKGFQPESAVGATQFGGVIGGTKFLKPTVTVTAERSTNSLIINADYDDYLQIYDLLQKIDTEQPQVAIRALVLNVSSINEREFGIQFRNRKPTLDGAISQDVNFQTSGLPLGPASDAPIIINPSTGPPAMGGPVRLLGNLVDLATSNVPGSTLVSLGTDAFGVWGLFKVLQTFSDASIVAKPFLVTTHKYNAQIKITEVRLVVTSTIVGGANTSVPTFDDMEAGLTLDIMPQISPDGLITLTVSVDNSTFTQPAQNSANPSANPNQGDRDDKRITTSVIVEDNQVLALGGLTQDIMQENEFKVPILGDIPILGWFFKSKRKTTQKTSLLILISAEIINPHAHERIESFTSTQMTSAQNLLDEMMCDEQLKDPIHRWFFEDDIDEIGWLMRTFDTNPSAHQKEQKKRERKGRVRMRGRRKQSEDELFEPPPLPSGSSDMLPAGRRRGRRRNGSLPPDNAYGPDMTYPEPPLAEPPLFIPMVDPTAEPSQDRPCVVSPLSGVMEKCPEPEAKKPAIRKRKKLHDFIQRSPGACS